MFENYEVHFFPSDMKNDHVGQNGTELAQKTNFKIHTFSQTNIEYLTKCKYYNMDVKKDNSTPKWTWGWKSKKYQNQTNLGVTLV